MTPTAIHVHPVQDDRCEALGNCIDASIMEVFSCTSNSVCVFIVFAIYPKLLNFTFVAFIPQEYLPLVLKPFHHGPYQDPQAL